jgi:glycosyltransferase involved in cell wall biosynthesis
MPRVSAIVITYNEEKNIERCLKSIQWADEVIVVDSFSTDRTAELTRKYTAHIISHAYDGEVPQRQRGFAEASGEWLFWIDADEEVSEELKQSILHTVNSSDAHDGYYLSRKASVLGKWIEHGGWFPDWQFRLVKKEKIVPEYQEIHGGFTTNGTKGKLEGILYHYTYATIAEYLRKMNDQTSLHVSNKLKDDPQINVGVNKLVLSPLSYFLRMFFVQKGYKDGMHGFLLACYSALYTMLMYAKTWEYRYRREESKGILPPIRNADVQRLKLKYSPWTAA